MSHSITFSKTVLLIIQSILSFLQNNKRTRKLCPFIFFFFLRHWEIAAIAENTSILSISTHFISSISVRVCAQRLKSGNIR